MDDRTLRKALGLLVHPLTLAAIAVLLVNDHLLRRLWPSGLTGKLGDFAWLFFLPLVLAVLLALVVPRRLARRSTIVGILAFGAVGLAFALAKTVPTVHAAVVAVAERVFAFPVGWRRDPTDLVALAALGASALLWARKPEPADGRIALTAPGWAVIALAMLLTVANSPAPDPGIFCLDERQGELWAYAGYSSYRSTDGGLTWTTIPDQPRGACPSPLGEAAATPVTVPDPRDPQRSFRFTPGAGIELSEDGGTTWGMVYTVEETSEAVVAATRRQSASAATVRPTPLDGAIDRATGNAIFAMGHAGVLVRDAAGNWQKVAVGDYRPLAVGGPFDFFRLLVGEILLAAGVVLLGFNTFATRVLVRGRALWIAALAIVWLIWAAVAFLFPPALASGYGSMLTYGAMLVGGVILLAMTVIAVVGVLQNGKNTAWRSIAVSAVAGALFLLPYALWAVEALPRYLLAAAFGAVLAAASLIAGSRAVWQRYDAAR